MALKALMLRKNISDKQKELEALRSVSAGFETREAEIASAIEEAQTDEERSAVEANVEQFEAEKAENEEGIAKLSEEIRGLEEELKAEEERSAIPAQPKEEKIEEVKKETKIMNRSKFFDMSMEERDAFFANDEIKEFLARTRNLSMEKRGVTGGDLLIPVDMLALIRKEVEKESKLLPYVYNVAVSGTARQNVMGAIPEGVWTEMCANLNDLPIVFNQIEVDGYKVGGYVAVCNATLKDSDINLASEIIFAIGGAIAKALDKAILYGTGTKMPVGIVTRLAQESQPASWGANAPTWTDLHTANIKKENIKSESGTTFFAHLCADLAIAKPQYSSEGLFWVMNRKTHLDIIAKALAFNVAGALVGGVNDIMPVVGGKIIEFEDSRIADYEIIGGYGKNYLLAEREGATFGQSEHALFLQDQTAFKGIARYDGCPVAGEAFVVVNYNNTDCTTSKTFEVDYANTDMNILTVTSANGTASGDTVLTVSNAKADSPTYKYKAKATANGIKVGDKVGSSWTSLTSGTTQITATAGTPIAVVELDSNSRVVSVGQCNSNPKA